MDTPPLAEAPRTLRLAAAARGRGWVGGGGRVWVEVVRGTVVVWTWDGVEPAGEGQVDAAFECAEARAGDLLRVSQPPPALPPPSAP